jgi:ketosteroid isomerase-like protein
LGRLHPANAPGLFGREEIKSWVSGGPKAAADFDFSNVEIIGVGNFAYATSDIAMNFEGMPADQGKQLVVLRKEPTGEWKTVAVSFNSNTPIAAASTTAQ